jgi:serine/threonine protein kinase
MALTTGTRLGPYEVVAALGAGGMGEVYRARDTRLGRDVAIKVLPQEIAGDADRLRRFEQEARAAAALNHPCILALYDVGAEGGVSYIVTELLEGRSLGQVLRSERLSVSRVVELSVQVADGLAAAHALNIVHRDVKPDNLFVTSEGRTKILDSSRKSIADSGDPSAGNA